MYIIVDVPRRKKKTVNTLRTSNPTPTFNSTKQIQQKVCD